MACASAGKLIFSLTNIFTISEINGANKTGACVSSGPPLLGRSVILYEKNHTIFLLPLSFHLSAIAEEAPDADNTAKNERDRSGETQTSGDQSNSPEDVKITAAIRRAVVGGTVTLHDGQECENYYR